MLNIKKNPTNQNTPFHFSCMHKTDRALYFQHYTAVNMLIARAMVLLKTIGVGISLNIGITYAASVNGFCTHLLCHRITS